MFMMARALGESVVALERRERWFVAMTMVKLEARLEAKAEAAKAVAMATRRLQLCLRVVWRRRRQQPCGKVDRPAG